MVVTTWTEQPRGQKFLVAPLARVNMWMITNTNIGYVLGNIRGGDTRLLRRRGEKIAPEVVLQKVTLACAEGAEKFCPWGSAPEGDTRMRRRREENFATEVVPCPQKSPQPKAPAP